MRHISNLLSRLLLTISGKVRCYAIFFSFWVFFLERLRISKAKIEKKIGPAIIQIVELKSPSIAGWIIVKKFANPTTKMTSMLANKAEEFDFKI